MKFLKHRILITSLMATVLSACNTSSSSNVAPQTTHETQTHELSHLPTTMGKALAMTLDNDTLLIVNDKGELWRTGDTAPFAQNVLANITPVAGFGKVAWADTDGNFTLWQNGEIITSNIRLSPHSALLMLPLATIAVQDDNGTARLVRLEVQDNAVQVVAHFSPVLPDARPIQLNFTGDNTQGHIAVLSHPDSTTYQHGVLGDKVEAGQLQFLERHTLTPLATPLSVRGLVFEANQPEILPHKDGNYLISTMAGGGAGARTVVVSQVKDSLAIVSQSKPLPANRWQSPFVFNRQLYAVHMPHLVGDLVQYTFNGDTLKPSVLGGAYSNHIIGAYETNLVASTDTFAVLPSIRHNNVSVLRPSGKLTPLTQPLPAHVVQALADDNTVYLLLANGEIWQVK